VETLPQGRYFCGNISMYSWKHEIIVGEQIIDLDCQLKHKSRSNHRNFIPHISWRFVFPGPIWYNHRNDSGRTIEGY
jgi:hypothetical protein